MLTLYDYFRSSASFRVRIALNLKRLDYEKIPVHLINNGGEQHSPYFKKMNPQELVPVLKDQEKIITQSLAIIEYLDEKYPEPKLLPSELVLKAFSRSIALSIAADVHPLNNLRVLNYLQGELHVSDEQKKHWYHHWMGQSLSALENRLSDSTVSGQFCVGDFPTIADICLVPHVYNARRYHCDMSLYPLLTKIDANCQQHPAFIHAWPHES